MTADRQGAARFFAAMFDGKPDSTVAMAVEQGDWGNATAMRSWRPLLDRAEHRPDAYFGCCALVRPPGRGRRGGADQAAFMPAAWADLDVNGSPKRDGGVVAGMAPSPAAVFDALRRCP